MSLVFVGGRQGRFGHALAFAAAAFSAFSAGCGPVRLRLHVGWLADYDTAESRVRETGRDMLIWYQDPRPGNTDPLEEVLRTPIIKSRIRGYVLCRLFKSYEPDRRYVAQFGVERAPALILVHTDGTCHSHSGLMSTETVYSFLLGAKAPGRAVMVNRHIPRRADYRWYRTPEPARRAAEPTQRPILFVFHRRLTGDWWRLEKLLSRREVYQRLGDMVHCRVVTPIPWADVHISEFGALRLPALVIARHDGTYSILETPTSYEAVVRFADASQEHPTAMSTLSPLKAVTP
ncbi:MAG: hypothetical protein ACE5HE_00125 [Phycisphaerae bacterium]